MLFLSYFPPVMLLLLASLKVIIVKKEGKETNGDDIVGVGGELATPPPQ